MKESNFWFLITIILVGTATFALLFPDYLPTAPMFVEMTATFFGVLIAVSLSEGIQNSRAENKDKRVLDDLIEELQDILKQSKRPIIRELFSATWTSIKTNGIPDRIDVELRKSLTAAFELFEICNESIRRREEYAFTTNPNEDNKAKLDYIIEDAKKRLIISAEKALAIAGISIE